MSQNTEGGKPERKVISMRMPLSLIEALDEVSWQQRTDRSDVIERACRFFVQAVTCPDCGTINAKGSKHCSICKHDFIADNRWLSRIENDVNSLILATHTLAISEKSLEGSYGELSAAQNRMLYRGDVVDKILELQLKETSLILQSVQKITIESEENTVLANIKKAEAFLRAPDMKEVAEMSRLISGEVMETEHLLEEVESMIAYNKKFISTFEEE